jgi:hypothetical protein
MITRSEKVAVIKMVSAGYVVDQPGHREFAAVVNERVEERIAVVFDGMTDGERVQMYCDQGLHIVHAKNRVLKELREIRQEVCGVMVMEIMGKV